jgi:sugar O-acyltransferase (sialic acid O-acetyltransferase NeuD family)
MTAAPPESVLVFPCNGNGVEALGCLNVGQRVAGFVDDTSDKQGIHVHGVPVFGREVLLHMPSARVLAVPGSPVSFAHRRGVIEGLKVQPERFAVAIHAAASVSTLATIGYNVLIMAGVVVTSNAVIGNHVCILPNTVIHHDAVIGNYSLIGSNVTIAGNAIIGENCYIGSASSIMNGIRIGDGALIGLGSNVIREVAAGTRVAGNPARLLNGTPRR